MYKVGDLVRIFGKGKVRRIVKISQVFGYRLEGDINFYISEELETVTHLTTNEFIKLVEDMWYELDVRTGIIFIKTKNYREVGWVRTDYECSAAFNFECDKLLLDIFYLYATTPLELREEKEQLYTLELPNTGNEYRYYAKGKTEYMFDDIDSITGYQKIFTQKEIDELPNQELIKTLIKKEVKDNE